ncbi:hypothetical protein ACLOAV_000179 [Pseudogymnoascus australis]
MGFHGYGGSELDHSDCQISPCSACQKQLEQQQLQQQQPSSRSGNTFSSSFNNPNDQGSRANVFGQENRHSNEAAHATGAGAVTDNTRGLSGDLQNLSISDQDRTLRDEMRQTGFNIPPAPKDPALRHQAGSQNLREAAGFQFQNQPEPRVQLSDEDRALRDEMRRTGFRIPSVSNDPALSRPDGSQNRSDTTGFQSPDQNQGGSSNTPGEATGSYPPGPSTPTGQFICPCTGCRSGLLPCSYAPPEEPTNRMTDGLAPWAYDHPTTVVTLRKVLRDKFLASQAGSQGSSGNPQTSTQSGAASQGPTDRPESPIDRLARLDGTGMQLEET